MAATNLGVILAERGLTARALDVWRPAFARHPEASELGVDLALATCQSGDWKGAEDAATDQVSRRP